MEKISLGKRSRDSTYEFTPQMPKTRSASRRPSTAQDYVLSLFSNKEFAQPSSPFFRIPRELRDEIYHLLLEYRLFSFREGYLKATLRYPQIRDDPGEDLNYFLP